MGRAENILLVSLLLVSGLLALILLSPDMTLTEALNPVAVKTTINVTNAPPYVFNLSTIDPLTLEANSSVLLSCNATVRDYNGIADIRRVNATFYDANIENEYTTSFTNRTKYGSTACTRIQPGSGNEEHYTCNFTVMYWSNPGFWTCNVTATDLANITGAANISLSINTLIAVSSPSVLDYGDIGVTETTGNTLFNLSNAGNADVNLTLYGYGRNSNDSTAMVCTYGNISAEFQRFTTNATNLSILYPFDSMDFVNNSQYNASYMYVHNGTGGNISGFVIYQRNSTPERATNTTIWRVYVPPGPAGTPSGICNGTLVFTASQHPAG